MEYFLRSYRPFLLFLALGFFSVSRAQTTYDQKQLEVSLRLVGHQLLLKSGDRTSRVLPIDKIDGRYRIQFENEFTFNPDDLIKVINTALENKEAIKGYIVEVEKCSTAEVVYSFEMDDLRTPNMLPCRGRNQPKDCYKIFLSLKEPPLSKQQTAESVVLKPKTNLYLISGLGLLLLLIVWILIVWKKRKKAADKNPHAIAIGAFQFDPRKATLYMAKLEIELSSKEADLLLLLHASANTTVAREIILNRVWGDEGDYVGRTLDVFISKLRKKLEADDSVRIVNVRGIGYKLVLDI